VDSAAPDVAAGLSWSVLTISETRVHCMQEEAQLLHWRYVWARDAADAHELCWSGQQRESSVSLGNASTLDQFR
jgi:hypothetical protein